MNDALRAFAAAGVLAAALTSGCGSRVFEKGSREELVRFERAP